MFEYHEWLLLSVGLCLADLGHMTCVLLGVFPPAPTPTPGSLILEQCWI